MADLAKLRKVTPEFCQKLNTPPDTFGSTLLIKTFSDNIIELTQSFDWRDIERHGKVIQPPIIITKYYLRFPIYIISFKDLKMIMDEGIKKMRFMTTRGIKDLNFETDVIGGYIMAQYNLVIKNTNFEDGF